MRLLTPSAILTAAFLVSAGSAVLDNRTALVLNGSLSRAAGAGSGEQVACLGLPRNTILASCPAPCLEDAPCVVYDQDTQHDEITGCDYIDPLGVASFCTSKPAQTCEFHCFGKPVDDSMMAVTVYAKTKVLGEPEERSPEDPGLLEDKGTAGVSNNFVVSVGKLNLSESIRVVRIIGSNNENSFVDVDVDPDILSRAPSVTSLTLRNFPIGNDRMNAIVVAMPSHMEAISFVCTNITALSWRTFASTTNLTQLSLDGNHISFISDSEFTMPALTELSMTSNVLVEFDVRAPKLKILDLDDNKLVRIPESVFTYSQLESLSLDTNRLIRPLVLTAHQVGFLEGLSSLSIDRLVDAPDQAIVSRLSLGGEDNYGDYGDYTDDVDISVLLEGSTESLLRGDPRLPIRVVGDEQAAMYNKLLEARAKHRVERKIEEGSCDDSGAVVMPTYCPKMKNQWHMPVNVCQSVPRNTLLTYCAEACPRNGACVAYDQDWKFSLPSGCDYDSASRPSWCAVPDTQPQTCEFQCFAAYEPESQFKFFIPIETDLGNIVPRSFDDEESDIQVSRTTEPPFLSNGFVDEIGALNLTSIVTEVMIAGGRSQEGSRGNVAYAVVSPKLLARAPAVTSLSLLNIDLRDSELTAIVSSRAALTSLDLSNTNIETLPQGFLANVQQLETLTLALNDITVFNDEKTTMPNLKTLNLSDNSLITVTIDEPQLKTLDLSLNNLVHIPPSVFSLKELQTLNLELNNLTFPLWLTASEQVFLNAVPDLRLSQVSISKRFGGFSLAHDSGRLTNPTANATATQDGSVSIDSALLEASGGRLSEVKGFVVIIVNETIAARHNNQLEQQQKESPPAPRTRSSSSGVLESSATNGSLTSTGDVSERLPTQDSSRDDGRSSDRSFVGEAAGSSSRWIGNNVSATRDNTRTPTSTRKATATLGSKGVSLSVKLMVGGLSSGVFVAFVAFFLFRQRRRKRAANQSPNYVAAVDKAEGDTEASTQPKNGHLVSWWKDEVLLSHRMNARDISDVRVIGSGSSSILSLVNYRSGSRKLVSKRLVQGGGPAYHAKSLQLVDEAKIAATLRHARIVELVGVSWTGERNLQVLYQYMSNGDLGSYLARNEPSTLLWVPTKLQFAIEIIEALVYTHSFNPPLLHRDLKASNVLLDDDFNAKLGGFGCARLESESNTMTASGLGTSYWLAPEVLSGSTSYLTSSDIYSFGVVLCELDTHQLPYAEDTSGLPDSARLQRVARGELRPAVSALCPVEIREVAEVCLAFDPNERPHAMQVAYTLRSLRNRHVAE